MGKENFNFDLREEEVSKYRPGYSLYKSILGFTSSQICL